MARRPPSLRPMCIACACGLLWLSSGPAPGAGAAERLQAFVGRPAAALIEALGGEYVQRTADGGAERLTWYWRETVVETGGRGPPETIVSGGNGRPSIATVPGEYRPPRAYFLECTVAADIDATGTVTRVTALDPGCRRLLDAKPILR